MELLEKLNPQQKQAVTAAGGAILVLAGPGSGKTRVLTHRIAYLVQHERVPAWRIMAVTFTNKAAREMSDRVANLLGGRPDGLILGTFHSTCARILRREAEHLSISGDFVIYDAGDQESVVKLALRTLNLDEKQYQPRQMVRQISRAKNELITPEMFPSETYLNEITRRVYEQYQKTLKENNAYDFGDLLMQVVLLLDSEPELMKKYQQRFQHVLVDEFQDTNTAQYALVKRLSGGYGNLFCVGDEDQSIYRFRGADWRNVRRFREDFNGQIILLEHNYRSTQVILDAAQAVIKQNPHRTHKALFTDRKGGTKITVEEAYNEDEEAKYILDTIHLLTRQSQASPGDFAIMYRTNAQSRRIEEAFIKIGMPYRLVGATRFYGRREVKDVIAYLRMVHNPSDSVSMLRVINVPPRGIGAKTIQTLGEWAASSGISMALALERLAAASDSGARHPFNSRAVTVLTRFANQLAGWTMRRDTLAAAELMDLVLNESGYRDYLLDGSPEGEERWDNILELRNVAAEYESLTLADFLEQISLVADVDNLTEETNAPVMLTLHSAKGLEFPVVFIVGVEEGILPHQRSMDDPEQMWEERRLFYVGITRAKNQLYLLNCFRRSSWGSEGYGQPSRFLADIPAALTTSSSVNSAAQKPQTEWSWTGVRADKPLGVRADKPL
ncbi:MAG: UvrD-helicase domain-containing protein, partial [Anaerolineales bacterium]|nr:UvrD-helicase domain-containing protein [Anaerolineales bacterium]